MDHPRIPHRVQFWILVASLLFLGLCLSYVGGAK